MDTEVLKRSGKGTFWTLNVRQWVGTGDGAMLCSKHLTCAAWLATARALTVDAFIVATCPLQLCHWRNIMQEVRNFFKVPLLTDARGRTQSHSSDPTLVLLPAMVV